MKFRNLSLAGAACALFAAVPSLASDIGNYPSQPPPDSLYPFSQPRTGQPAAPAPRDAAVDPGAPQAGTQEATTDRATGVVTDPGYMGPRSVKGQ